MITYVDIGARGGIDQRWRLIRNHLRVVAFEPNPDEQDDLKKQIWWDAEIIPMGLWVEKRKMSLYITQNPGLSSLLKPKSYRVKDLSREQFQIVKTIEIDVDTLDSFDLKPDFIKLDTQGTEFDILRGAEESLKTCIGIQVEVEYEEIYEGQATFYEVHELLTDAGFEIWDMNARYLSGERRTMFSDVLYFKKGTEENPKRKIMEQIYKGRPL